MGYFLCCWSPVRTLFTYSPILKGFPEVSLQPFVYVCNSRLDLFWIDLCRVRDMNLMSFLDTMTNSIDTFPAKVSWYCVYKLSPTKKKNPILVPSPIPRVTWS